MAKNQPEKSVYVHGCPVRHKRAIHSGICLENRCGRKEACVPFAAWREINMPEKGDRNDEIQDNTAA